MISRRVFLMLTGGALLAPSACWPAEKTPSMLDHILLGCSDLDAGIAFVEERTGIRAAFGGVHPGRGTRNALLSLGEQRYLEIIAPDPKQTIVQPGRTSLLSLVKNLGTARVIGWATHPGNIEVLAKTLRARNIACKGPFPGSRSRPDGRVLNWKTLNLDDDDHGKLPFFIEWGAGTVHPSVDAPRGCHLEQFVIADPDPAKLSKTLERLAIDVPVEYSAKSELRAQISSPKGVFEITS